MFQIFNNGCHIGSIKNIHSANTVEIRSNGTVYIDGKCVDGDAFSTASVDRTCVNEVRSIDGSVSALSIETVSTNVRIWTDNKLRFPAARLTGDVQLFSGTLPTLEVVGGRVSVVSCGNCSYSGTLTLEVAIPANSNVRSLKFRSTSGNICVGDVYIARIDAGTESGAVEICNARFCELQASSKSGKITLQVSAENDFSATIASKSGNVKLSLRNLRKLNHAISSATGDVKRRFKPARNGYTANLAVTTATGNIDLC